MLTNVCGMFKLMLMKSYLEGVGVFVVLWKVWDWIRCVWHEKCLLLIMIAECQMKILLEHEMWVKTWMKWCTFSISNRKGSVVNEQFYVIVNGFAIIAFRASKLQFIPKD